MPTERYFCERFKMTMKNLVISKFASFFVGAVFFTSCISSQEAYNKSKLSGFVANQTTDLIKKNTPAPVDNSNLTKTVAEHTEKIQALDADNSKAKAMVAELEKGLNELEAMEKEAKMEFERSNTSVVFFDLGSSTLTANAMQELYRWKSAMDQGSTHYNFNVSVFASADKSGSKKLNDKLRTDRANAVKNFIVNVLGYKGEIILTTEQPAFSKVNDIDRRVILTVNCKN